MTIIIEDGSVVANANSYATLAETRAYALARGVTLSAVDSTLEPMLISSMDYLESFRKQYQGQKVSGVQSLQFPRYGVTVDGFEVASNAIPLCLKQAQMQLVMQKNAGIDLMPTRSEPFIVEDTVGPLTTKYSEKVAVSASPEMTAVDALLTPLFGASNVGMSLRTVRV